MQDPPSILDYETPPAISPGNQPGKLATALEVLAVMIPFVPFVILLGYFVWLYRP